MESFEKHVFPKEIIFVLFAVEIVASTKVAENGSMDCLFHFVFGGAYGVRCPFHAGH